MAQRRCVPFTISKFRTVSGVHCAGMGVMVLAATQAACRLRLAFSQLLRLRRDRKGAAALPRWGSPLALRCPRSSSCSPRHWLLAADWVETASFKKLSEPPAAAGEVALKDHVSEFMGAAETATSKYLFESQAAAGELSRATYRST